MWDPSSILHLNNAIPACGLWLCTSFGSPRGRKLATLAVLYSPYICVLSVAFRCKLRGGGRCVAYMPNDAKLYAT